jgi:hypothetical protein
MCYKILSKVIKWSKFLEYGKQILESSNKIKTTCQIISTELGRKVKKVLNTITEC